MAQNITIANAAYSDVPYLTVPLTAGGTTDFLDTSDATATASEILAGYTAYSGGAKVTGTASGGSGLEYVSRVSDETYKLADTSFASWTPSTSNGTVLSSATKGNFVATSLSSYIYYVYWLIDTRMVYQSGTATAKGMYLGNQACGIYSVYRRPNGVDNLAAMNRTYNMNASLSTVHVGEYYSSASAKSTMISVTYGIYPSAKAPTVGSTSAESPLVTCISPIIYAKCSTTYFSTTMAAAVDQDESTIHMVCDVYRAPIGSPAFDYNEVYEMISDIYNNGIT